MSLPKRQKSSLEESNERGIVKGRTEGREEGRKEERIRHFQFCERLLWRAETPAEQLMALSLEQLEHLTRQLETELTRPPATPS